MSVTGASIKDLLNFVPVNNDEDSLYIKKNKCIFNDIGNAIEMGNIGYLEVTWAKFLIGPDKKINPDEKITLEIINKAKEEIELILKEGHITWARDPDAVRNFGYYEEKLKKMCKIEKIVQTYIQIYNDRETSNSCVLTLSSSSISSEPNIED